MHREAWILELNARRLLCCRVNGFGNPVWNWFTDTFQINNEIKIKTDAVAIKEQRLETAI